MAFFPKKHVGKNIAIVGDGFSTLAEEMIETKAQEIWSQ